MRLKIAARSSDLARLQAQAVGQALLKTGEVSSVDYNFRASLGDINQNDPLWKMPEKGVFTEDFLQDLISGACDLVVHSWKDLPTEPRKDTEIVATLPRADLRDLFLFNKSRLDEVKKTKTLRVLTSSPRRAYNLEAFFKSHLPFQIEKVEFLNVRGNIPTRIRKLFSESADGLVVAKAALDRLLTVEGDEYHEVQRELRNNLNKSLWAVLPLSINPTAAAQGALAIEVKKDRSDLKNVFSKIHCERTFSAVQKERKILSSYGGGCHQKIGVSVIDREFGEVLFLQGLTDTGEKLDRVSLTAERTLSKTESRFVWPLDPADGFFTREVLPPTLWQVRIENAQAIYVARDSALPEGQTLFGKTVWTAGTKTWRRLAARGVWVNGTSDSLGETEPADIAALLNQDFEPQWLKLTHETSAQGDANSVATYRLVPKKDPADLKGKTHLFWMSGSSFKRAIQLYPELKAANHACGPGKTHDALRSELGPTAKISVFLGYEDWLRHITLG